MAFQKGKSGNPKGRAVDKPWRDMLAIALKEKDATGTDALRRVAQAVVDAALNGDMQAAKEIGDRLDGKPVQAVESNTEVTHYVIAIPTRQQSSKEWASQLDQTIQ